MKRLLYLRILLSVTLMSDQDPDPHWFGSLVQDPHWDKRWIKVRIETKADPRHWFYLSYHCQRCHNSKKFGRYIEILRKKYCLSTFLYAWYWYRSGSTGSGSACPGCLPRSGSGKTMLIRPKPNPDPQHCNYCTVDLLSSIKIKTPGYV
jgi:hypothetical protein